MATIDEFIQDATRRMDKSVESTHDHFNSVRTGRASAALLDRITVDYYGTQTPLKQMATINVPEPRMLTIQPFDPSQIKSIEKAKMERSWMPRSIDASTMRRTVRAPARCPAAVGRRRRLAQRPLPSMMIATVSATSGRSRSGSGRTRASVRIRERRLIPP